MLTVVSKEASSFLTCLLTLMVDGRRLQASNYDGRFDSGLQIWMFPNVQRKNKRAERKKESALEVSPVWPQLPQVDHRVRRCTNSRLWFRCASLCPQYRSLSILGKSVPLLCITTEPRLINCGSEESSDLWLFFSYYTPALCRSFQLPSNSQKRRTQRAENHFQFREHQALHWSLS